VQRIVQKIRGRQKSSVALFILRVNQNHRRRLHHSSTKPEKNFFSGANLIFQKQKSFSHKTENNSQNKKQIASFCAAAPTSPLLL